MDIDLSTYGKEILSAYHQVVKSSTDTWALFGYDRNGCSIKLLATGGNSSKLFTISLSLSRERQTGRQYLTSSLSVSL
jgi:hypothetical protein